MQTVELRTAYHWFCETCGSTNFSLPQSVEMTDEAREAAYRSIENIPEFVPVSEFPEFWNCFELVCIPEKVTCSQCGESFATVDESESSNQDL